VLKCEGPGSEEQRVRERQVATSVLYHSVSVSLALLSPFMPFLTEEMWQRLVPYGDSDRTSTSLCVQPYPKTSQLVSQSETQTQLYFWHKTTLFNLLLHHRSTGTFLRRKQTSLWYRKLSEWRGYWGPSARWQRKDLTVRKSLFFFFFFLLHANVLVLVAVFGKASITTETLMKYFNIIW